ncbi:MAG: asparagine synthase (glutamine-hydrolyzing), partial [Flavobacteriales bacterium]|nr:asparagine synthase (glutamine-hydrolyzing) [Flavobacteriales bacterium]
YDFETNSDSEVIIAAYHKWGKDCVKHFNGMFAFAIWDNKKEELFIARDRVGIKPLYFYQDENKFIFSSQIKGVLASEKVKCELNSSQLSNYLRFQTIYAPNTILKDIYLLEAGTTLLITNSGIKKEKYWSINKDKTQLNTDSYSETKSRINSLLTSAIERRMVSDVPFGAFLSGGIDSSLMVALMSKVSTTPINTFNISFAEREFSEAKYAEAIAKKHKTNHTEINLTPTDLLEDIETAISYMDSPSADGINTFVVSKHTRKHGVKMAISGLGGDELFAGYPQFKQMNFLNKIKCLDKIPHSLRSTIANVISSNTTKPEIQKISNWLGTSTWDMQNLYPTFRQQSTESDISKIINSKSEERIIYHDKSTLLNNMSVNEVNTYLQHVLLRDSDQMSMASALEVRVPFMDHELIDYVLTVPDKYKYPKTQKKLLVDSFPEILTPEITNRKKMGFVFPWDKWLRNELKEFVEINLAELENYPEFNYSGIRNMWDKYLKGDKSIYWTQIWGLVVLGKWLKSIDFK